MQYMHPPCHVFAELAAYLQNTNRFASPCWTALRGFDKNGKWVCDKLVQHVQYKHIGTQFLLRVPCTDRCFIKISKTLSLYVEELVKLVVAWLLLFFLRITHSKSP